MGLEIKHTLVKAGNITARAVGKASKFAIKYNLHWALLSYYCPTAGIIIKSFI